MIGVLFRVLLVHPAPSMIDLGRVGRSVESLQNNEINHDTLFTCFKCGDENKSTQRSILICSTSGVAPVLHFEKNLRSLNGAVKINRFFLNFVNEQSIETLF